jgi:hypothetical protein
MASAAQSRPEIRDGDQILRSGLLNNASRRIVHEDVLRLPSTNPGM